MAQQQASLQQTLRQFSTAPPVSWTFQVLGYVLCTITLNWILWFFRNRLIQVFLDVGEVTDRIMSVVKNFDQVDAAKVTPDSKWADLGLDSLDAVEVVMAIEDEFAIEIPDPEADKILSVAEAIDFISTHPMAK